MNAPRTAKIAVPLALVASLAAGCAPQSAACAQLSDAEIERMSRAVASAQAAGSSAGSTQPPAATSASARVIPYDLPNARDFVPPPAVGPSDVPLTPMLTVEVTAAGTVSCDGRVVALDELLVRARVAKQANPEIRAVIRADRKATYEMVIEVMDRLKQGGIAKIAFGVEPKPAP